MKISQSDMEHIKKIKKLLSKAYNEMNEVSPEGYAEIEKFYGISSLEDCIRRSDFIAHDIIEYAE